VAESAVADDAHGHRAFESGGAGDRCGAGEGFERFGVGEAGPVIADFAEDAVSEHGAQSREAGDDRRVGVLGECLAGGLFEVSDVGHCGVQRPEMGQHLATHRLLHQRELGELLAAQAGQDPIDLVVDVALSPAAYQRGPQRGATQFLGCCGGGCHS
jgi:hypothetical protein